MAQARARQEAAFLCRRMFANGLLRLPAIIIAMCIDDNGDDEDVLADEYRAR